MGFYCLRGFEKMKELIGKTVHFGNNTGEVVGYTDEIEFGPLHDGSERTLPPALRIIPEGEEHLEPVEVHPERCYERN